MFFAIGMAGNTIMRVIIFISVFIIHLAVIMAAIARIVRRVPARMTFGTLAVCSLVIDREAVIE